MSPEVPLVDLAPLARLAMLALLVALLPLSYVWLRRRGEDTRTRLAGLTAVTLFLTFDLIVFGSFTRLTDSGLGCPDWPGCYGEASPFGAREEIHAAQTALPSGPVTWSKAWIEMIHRYLAMTVGVLILVMAWVSWTARHSLPHSPWWPTLTLVWVIVQGLFGKYTVTLKLYPLVVTLHLLGGLFLLTLLVWQHEHWRDRAVVLGAGLRRAAWVVFALLWMQIALGGWVSTNYAVLACQGFPQCNGQWWPQGMQWREGFTLLRELGRAGHGGYLGFDGPGLGAGHPGAGVEPLAPWPARAAALCLGTARIARLASRQRHEQRRAWLAHPGGLDALGGGCRLGGVDVVAAGTGAPGQPAGRRNFANRPGRRTRPGCCHRAFLESWVR
jgi:heme a synthase